MGIRDTYKTEASKASAPAKPQGSSGTPAARGSAGAAPSSEKPAGQSPEDRRKVLAAIQAKMAARQQAGAAVNPPEGSDQVTEDKLLPMPDEAAESDDDTETAGAESPAQTPSASAAPERPKSGKGSRGPRSTPSTPAATPGSQLEASIEALRALLPPGTAVTVSRSHQ